MKITINHVRDLVERIPGLQFDDHSPGDGVTRYRLFTDKQPACYFSCAEEVFTGLGARETVTFLRGYAAANARA